MVILPVVLEQPWNAAQAVAMGYGIHVSIPMPTKPETVVKNLSPALKLMLADESYTIKAKQISQLIQAEHWSRTEQAAGNHYVLVAACSMLIMQSLLGPKSCRIWLM